jgi:hypothetical protein
MKQTMDINLQYQLEYMDEADLLHAWQIRCDELNCMDDSIFDMDDFNELMNGFEPIYIAFRVHFGNFSPHHDFFKFDGYGNLESSNYLSDFIDLEELADEINEHDNLADELVNAGLLEEWRNEDE